MDEFKAPQKFNNVNLEQIQTLQDQKLLINLKDNKFKKIIIWMDLGSLGEQGANLGNKK